MNRDIVVGRMERELSRRQLAMRMIGHRARTQTIEEYTGLTRHQIANMRLSAGVPTGSRFRGPAPTSFRVFFSSARMRNESAVLSLLYCALGASKLGKRNGSADLATERGRQLCEIYETWQRLVPSSPIEFEQFVLLGDGVTREEQISFKHCGNCRAIIVIDLLGTQRILCDHCARARREEIAPSSLAGKVPEDEETDLVLYRLQLLGGQLLCVRNGSYVFEARNAP